MVSLRSWIAAGIVVSLGLTALAGEAAPAASGPYAQWKLGPDKSPSYFPIGVWMQAPAAAPIYQKAGINLYVGLWQGPYEAQLKTLKKVGMPVVCSQNGVGLAHKDDSIIVAWMLADEPDNAQSLGKGKGFGPPVPPTDVQKSYQVLREADPTRPVLLNLGEGAAWDGPRSRGSRVNHPEDYAEYVKGCDIVSLAIYPAASSNPTVQGDLSLIAQGVDRLLKWSDGKKLVWAFIECTRVNSGMKATPEQVKAEVWLAITHGASGIVYFVHEFKPTFREQALLNDRPMLQAVTAINRQVSRLAGAINSPAPPGGVKVESTDSSVPVSAMARVLDGDTYVFAVAADAGATKADFTLEGLQGDALVEAIGEDRDLKSIDGKFSDDFRNWGVHLYKISKEDKQLGKKEAKPGKAPDNGKQKGQ
jgi:hypothetical protein